ncbi:MAG: manganese efflux pump [Eubacteriales bacterium]|nr:manganese efflux pump [Eubacteriales bacterium]
MGLIEITVLAVGLAMDAVAVSMTNGMVYKNLGARHYILMPLFFGVFQGIMPLFGYYAGNIFADVITTYGGFIIFTILFIIGAKMIKDSFCNNSGDCGEKKINLSILFFQGIATSIDAFAVGVGFCAIRVNVIPAVSIISIVTAILVTAAIVIGKKFGNLFESKAEIFGGIILIAIGIKALF